MTWNVALILGIDGFANGAIYLLAGLGLVLIFSVTRVVFIPFGDVAAFAALSLAAFETGRTAGHHRLGGDAGRVGRHHGGRRTSRGGANRSAFRGHCRAGACSRLLPCALAWAIADPAVPAAVRVAVAVTLVVPITPLVARVALQPIADASVLVLLIVSLALHFLLSGLGLLFFGPEGTRTQPLVSGTLDCRAASRWAGRRSCWSWRRWCSRRRSSTSSSVR